MAAAPRHRRPGLQGRRASSRPLVFILAEFLSGRTRGPANRRGEKTRGQRAAPCDPGKPAGITPCSTSAQQAQPREFQRPHISQNQDTYITPPSAQPTPRHRYAFHCEFRDGEAQRWSWAVSGFAEQHSGQVTRSKTPAGLSIGTGSRLPAYRRNADNHSAIAANIDAGAICDAELAERHRGAAAEGSAPGAESARRAAWSESRAPPA